MRALLLICVILSAGGCKRLLEGECGGYEARARGPLGRVRDVMRESAAKLPSPNIEAGAELASGLASRIGSQLTDLEQLELKGDELGRAGADLREKLGVVQAQLTEVSAAYRELSQDHASAPAAGRVRRGLDQLGVAFTAYAQSGRRFEAVCSR